MRRLLVIIISIYSGLWINAQDPLFSQFYANPLYLAPSFAGSSPKGARAALNYRNQWPVIPKAFITYSGSVDYYIPKLRSGVGLSLLRDQAGTANLRFTNLTASYSFDFKVTPDFHVRPGVNFKYLSTAVDYEKMKFYEQVIPDGGLTTVQPFSKVRDFDVDVSTMVYTDRFWAGLTASHFMKPNIYFYNYNYNNDKGMLAALKYSFFGGIRFKLRGNLIKYYKESLTLSYLYEKQGIYNQLNLGAYYHKNPLVFGFWYRGIPFFKKTPGHDAIVFLAGYKINDLINVGYSYDFTVSGLSTSTGGSHEVSMIYDFHVKERAKKPTSIPCPHF